MNVPNVKTAEVLFILGFGVFHFALPFIFSPNLNMANLFGFLRIADFVLPGCFILAIISIVFYVVKSRYLAALLAFLYGGGVIFHVLFLSGLFPSVIIVPTSLISIAGIVIDSLCIIAIYDYYSRVQLSH
ncbi:MAG TPA: hypothetical protein VLU95_00045 [Candidatus Acidoferrum sp.]|nr:hypothetical protein [Candidatus Acidoferrum sp.]